MPVGGHGVSFVSGGSRSLNTKSRTASAVSGAISSGGSGSGVGGGSGNRCCGAVA